MTEILTSTQPTHDTLRTRFRPVFALLAAFVLVSGAMEALLIVRSATGASLESAIWIRCSLVLASSIVLLLIARSAARGSRSAFIRLRIIAVVVVIAVVVIVSIPGFLPDWVRIEQGVCGALVLPAAVLVNLPRVASLYPAAARRTDAQDRTDA